MKHLFNFVFFLLGVVFIFSTTAIAQEITLKMTSPADKATFAIGDNITIGVALTNSGSSQVSVVQLYQNGFWMADLTPDVHEFVLENAPNGVYRFSAVAVVDENTSYTSDTVTVNVGNTVSNDRAVNGEFNNTTWPWRFDNYDVAQGTIEIVPDAPSAGLTGDASAAHITIQNPGPAFWTIQLMQQFKLQKNHTYLVSFVAWAEAEKAIQVTFSMDYDPWATHWYEDVNLSTTPTKYGPYTYKPDFDDPRVMFKFILGGNTTGMYLDAVKILDLDDNTGTTEEITLTMTAPGNGAHYAIGDDINISVDVKNTGSNTISALKLFQNGFQLASIDPNNPSYVFADVPSGVYKLSAQAIDNTGKTSTSDTLTVNVGGVDPKDKALNGEFNGTKWPWRFDNYVNAVATFDLYPEANLTPDPSAAYIQIQNQGDQFWAIQLMQQFQLQAGHVYDVSFVAWATEPKAIQIAFSMDYDPWASHWWYDINVEAEPQTYGPYTFDCQVDDPRVMFKFILGGNTIPMFLDAVKIIDRNAPVAVEDGQVEIVNDYRLNQNYPNPFNPSTKISYQLKQASNVNLVVYDLLGKEVAVLANGKQAAGYHEVSWNASGKASGIYFYRLSTDEGFVQTKKLTLIR